MKHILLSIDGWEFVGIYADEAISGTKDTREEFNRMVEDARAGKIDLIITKAISRFARNTTTLLSTIRELTSLGVDVLFEEQNIHSISSEGEMILTLLASVAQEEARSTSENMKWRIKHNFEEGLPWGALLYGYKVIDFKYYIVEEEAKIIRLIYQLFLDGLGKEGIARKLNEMGYKTRIGANWSDTSVRQILTNYDYTGNLILQKTYRIDYISKKSVVNHGELPKYHVEESHDAIIDLETWNKVQEEMKRRRERIKWKKDRVDSPLKGKIKCGCCGKNYLRKAYAYRTFWICATYARKGKDGCLSKRIDEGELFKIIEELKIKIDSIKEITINNDIRGRNYIMFLQFLDGVKPQGDIVESDLNGKSLCVSLNYEIGHFKEMLSLVQLLTNHNATYKMKASDNDIFVTCEMKDDEGNLRYCSRLKHVNDAIKKGKDIKIISFDELLKALNVTEEELSAMPFPDASSFYKKPNPKEKRT